MSLKIGVKSASPGVMPAFSGMYEPRRNPEVSPKMYIDNMASHDQARLYDLLRHNVTWTTAPGLLDQVTAPVRDARYLMNYLMVCPPHL